MGKTGDRKKGPNLQNIPIRTPEGRRIRDAFRRPLPHVDYATLERHLLERGVVPSDFQGSSPRPTE